MVAKLEQYPQMRFIYAEMSFFSLWWSQIDLSMRQRVKKLVGFCLLCETLTLTLSLVQNQSIMFCELISLCAKLDVCIYK